jgi:hypothetical protein
MPNAVANIGETVRHELKSLPGGFVELRRMTYGQTVQRRAMLKLSVQSGGGRNKGFAGEMAMASEEIQQFEFRVCVVDHNLEDENGNKLPIATPAGFARLHPKIGQEIEKLIGEMNNLEDDEEESLGD